MNDTAENVRISDKFAHEVESSVFLTVVKEVVFKLVFKLEFRVFLDI
jgi:hypothetical protein